MVVFFDIDGTLVDDRTQIIPESAVRAVSLLRQAGHIPVINTGRPYTHIDPRIRAMDFAGFVCGCGMEIVLNDRYLYRNYPDPALCALIRDAVRECRMQVLYESQDGAILMDGERSSNEMGLREVERLRKKGLSILEIDSLPEPRFLKLVTFDGPGCRREDFKKKVSPYYTCIERGYTMLELVKRDCSKAKGMEIMLKALGASAEDTLAIGDSTNDLTMFAAAAHTVCMGNGAEEVKAQVEYVTDTVLGDGIEKALQHYSLI